MLFNYAFTATLILTLTSSVLASNEILKANALTAFKARDVVTENRKDSGSCSPDLNRRMNHSEDDRIKAEKRRATVDPYTAPYSLQIGPTRYAPMAKKPGTVIATASPTPQFPASPYKIATEYLKPGTVETTLTASETLSVTMMENTATPASHP
ncbi:hypothetical protein BDV12DRAFT_67824 [Aspergillus spectabilis]